MVDAVVGKTRDPACFASAQLPSSPQFLCHHRSADLGWLCPAITTTTAITTQHFHILHSRRQLRRRLRLSYFLAYTTYTSLQRGSRQIALRFVPDTTQRDKADPNQPLISTTTTTSPTQHRSHVLHPPQAKQPLPLCHPSAAGRQRNHNPRQRTRDGHVADGRERRGAAVRRDGGELEG